MDVFPFDYVPIPPTTWAYLSSFLMLALFFKFNRFWSFRNLDLILIMLLAPGLLMIEAGQRQVANQKKSAVEVDQDADETEASNLEQAESFLGNGFGQAEQATSGDSSVEERDLDSPGYRWQRWGYCWLFIIGGALAIRFLIDPNLLRRPFLEPNLSIGGLVFLGCALMAFLFANIIASQPTTEDLIAMQNAIKVLQREASGENDTALLAKRGPGMALFSWLPIIPSFKNGDEILNADTTMSADMSRYIIAAKSLAIGGQSLIVLGLILFCFYHYNSFNVGVGTATVYLMLPYTALFTGHVLHVLPAALIIWALVSIRRPLVSGVLVGLATGVSYYPIFLLPLWASFYWERGKRRFVTGFLVAIGISIGSLVFTSVDPDAFLNQLQTMFGFWRPLMDGLEGIWALGWNQWWRLPIMVTFVLLCFSFAAWPFEKNIGTLVSYTAVVMILVQFWHGFGGGLYMAWYLPLVLLTVFRPNLGGRVAVTELTESVKKPKETAEDFLPAG